MAGRGPVEEGAVGGGTGMICHGFKGGIGTASRVIAAERGGYAVGVLVQANHGRRERLTVAGAPVGRVISHDAVPDPDDDLPEATEAAIVNALPAAVTTTGRRGATAYGLEPERLLEAMKRFGPPS